MVKIFVRFAEPKQVGVKRDRCVHKLYKYSVSIQVDAARAALDKRFFGGHTVSAEIYDQAMFDHNDLSG